MTATAVGGERETDDKRWKTIQLQSSTTITDPLLPYHWERLWCDVCVRDADTQQVKIRVFVWRERHPSHTHTHTHTHTHVGFYGLRGLSIGVMVFILYKLYVLLPYTYPTPKLSPHRRRCVSIFPQKKTIMKYEITRTGGTIYLETPFIVYIRDIPFFIP